MNLGFGCVKLGSASSGRSLNDDVRLVQEAVERGVAVFDTADAYGSGMSERVLGRGLRGRRDGVVIATKGGYRFRPRSPVEQAARRAVTRAVGAVRRRAAQGAGSGPSTGAYASQEFTAPYLRQALDASLRRLGTDRVDVYQLHGPRDLVDDLIADLGDLVTAGKVGRFGVGAERLVDARGWAQVEGIDVVQAPFGVLDPEAARDLFPHIGTTEVWVRGVLGGGVLQAASRDPAALDGHPKRALIGRLDEIGRRLGLGRDELAMAFARSFAPAVSAVLVGIGSPEHLRRNLELFRLDPLPPDVVEQIVQASAEGSARG